MISRYDLKNVEILKNRILEKSRILKKTLKFKMFVLKYPNCINFL